MTDTSPASGTNSWQFANVVLGTRSGTSEGQLWLSHKGLFWKKLGGGRSVDISRSDLDGFAWSKAPRGGQLAVTRRQGPLLQFQGFKEKDADKIADACRTYGLEMKREDVAVAGRNWGEATIDGGTLVFRVAGKPAFRVPLKDVGQVQQGRDEVTLEFPVDDTGGEREDALVGMSFHVPRDGTSEFAGDDDTSSTKVFYDAVLEHTDANAATGDAVATFDNVTSLAPRGRFTVELYLSSLKLEGQAQDFRIQYDAITRLLVLPKSNTPHTVVVISVDPPIRKGQTFYAHLLIQFGSDEDTSLSLDITDEQLAAKNKDSKHELVKDQEGPTYDVFARVLRGLSNSKLAKPGKFRTADGLGYALRCSYKADEGFLYPLERAFFYIHKPPMLLPHDEIAGIEFMRQGGGVLAASAKTFDLSIRLASNDQEYLFRGIPKGEWTNLFNFIQAKKLRIDNLREAEMGPGAAVPQALDLGDDIDTGMAQMQAKGELDDEDEEDEDFDAGGAEAEVEAEDDAASSSGGSEVEQIEAPKEKKAKRPAPAAPRPSKAPKAAKTTNADADDAGGKKKRKKKDKNAPKGALSAFMYFSTATRDEVKAENPGISFGEIGKIMGQKWKEADAGTKAPFEEQAAQDKARYKQEMEAYKAKLAEGGSNSG